jgi:flagellar biogenesis protein FliO
MDLIPYPVFWVIALAIIVPVAWMLSRFTGPRGPRRG